MHGFSPTYREIAAGMNLASISLVQARLRKLQQKRYIDKEPRKARSITLRFSTLPLQGLIQAGYLTEHPDGCFDPIRLEGRHYGPDDYALKVCGNSMVGAQIQDGDIVVIRPETDLWAIRPGQIAAVWIGGEGTTLKHIHYAEGDSQCRLTPANPDHPERRLDRDQIGLAGVMVGQHRYQDGLWLAIEST